MTLWVALARPDEDKVVDEATAHPAFVCNVPDDTTDAELEQLKRDDEWVDMICDLLALDHFFLEFRTATPEEIASWRAGVSPDEIEDGGDYVTIIHDVRPGVRPFRGRGLVPRSTGRKDR